MAGWKIFSARGAEVGKIFNQRNDPKIFFRWGGGTKFPENQNVKLVLFENWKLKCGNGEKRGKMDVKKKPGPKKWGWGLR